VASGLLVLGLATVGTGASSATDGSGRVGNETCESCHDEVVRAFRSSVHWKADPVESCEGCHGPGEAHANEADPALILRFGEDTSTTERNGACLECHGRDRKVRHYASGDHGLSTVACVRCHSPHGSTRESLLVRETPGLCYECHPNARAEFALNERHPVEQGGIDCQDCHDPHGRSQRSVLGGFKQEMCLRCHTEHRGPWVFEHEAVAVEGCGSCHVPHGSVNRHLLTYQRAGDLCLQCHPEQPFFHDLTDASGARTSSYNVCTNCHVAIHGSNNDALFLN
jgi:DmsE family decaheme c-type cytochrome